MIQPSTILNVVDNSQVQKKFHVFVLVRDLKKGMLLWGI